MKTLTSFLYAMVALTMLSACSTTTTAPTDCVKPTLTPPGGSYSAGTIPVTIQTTTAEAYLSWTVDGTQPTPTHGHIVKAHSVQVPILCVFGRTMRLRTIAFKPGGCVSEVVEGRYVGH